MEAILLNALGYAALAILCYMSLWFVAGYFLKRNDVADIAWGLGFIMVTVMLYVKFGAYVDRGLLVTLLVTIWGSRLSYHIFRRNVRQSEDKRYVAWREAWGKWYVIRSYFQIFLLQGFLLFLIVMPVMVTNVFRGGSWNALDALGILVWIFGFYFESTGDRQLRKFLSDPSNKGKILNTGLWKYTRHPNYFGEVTQWWGLWIIALSVPYGFVSIIGPITITFLILKVSGVPMLERSMSTNPLFDEYRRTTSKFIPNFFK